MDRDGGEPVLQTSLFFKNSIPVTEQARAAVDHLFNRQDLGFLNSPSRENAFQAAKAFAHEIGGRFERLVVVGLGGSQLGGQCLVETLGSEKNRVEFWGEIDPAFVSEQLNRLVSHKQLSSTYFLFVSKSGATLELAVLLNLISGILVENGLDPASQSGVITENKPSPLFDWATENGIQILEHPLDVGGRFSVLTVVGLVPAAFAGVDIDKLRQGSLVAAASREKIAEAVSFFVDSFSKGCSITVFWSYVYQLQFFQKWLEQIWAESLGQAQTRAKKPAPLVSTPLMVAGVSAQHSVLQQFMDGPRDKAILFFRYAEPPYENRMTINKLDKFSYLEGLTDFEVFDAESRAVEEALARQNVVCGSLEMKGVDARSLGELLFFFQSVVGALGEYFDMNVFVQPGVELGKKLAQQKLQSLKERK